MNWHTIAHVPEPNGVLLASRRPALPSGAHAPAPSRRCRPAIAADRGAQKRRLAIICLPLLLACGGTGGSLKVILVETSAAQASLERVSAERNKAQEAVTACEPDGALVAVLWYGSDTSRQSISWSCSEKTNDDGLELNSPDGSAAQRYIECSFSSPIMEDRGSVSVVLGCAPSADADLTNVPWPRLFAEDHRKNGYVVVAASETDASKLQFDPAVSGSIDLTHDSGIRWGGRIDAEGRLEPPAACANLWQRDPANSDSETGEADAREPQCPPLTALLWNATVTNADGKEWSQEIDLDSAEEQSQCDMDEAYACLEVPVSCGWEGDEDCDGYGTEGSQADCNDSKGAINPGAAEICNDMDDNCNSQIDEDLPTQSYYLDGDEDGHGDVNKTVTACSTPPGYVPSYDDCDDSNPLAYPDAQELCNDMDDDCDDQEDEGVKTTFYKDDDGDGYGQDASTLEACTVPAGYSDSPEDCDDSNAFVNPDAAEICNDMDDDCDGKVEEGVEPVWFADGDSDGHGDPEAPLFSCEQEFGYVNNGDDCDDSRGDIYPGAAESAGDSVDSNCDGSEVCYVDADDDGFRPDDESTIKSRDSDCTDGGEALAKTPAGDCEDNDASVHPFADEVCNGIDDNCDGETDEGVKTTFYYDGDGDGYGQDALPQEACTVPDGYSESPGDCDDSNPLVNPKATEGCNGIDEDCDDQIDEGVRTTFYEDGDGDGYGQDASTREACTVPAGFSESPGDCDDSNAFVNPMATELCNGIDDDCEGHIDENIPTQNYYLDGDKDGFGDANETAVGCSPPLGYISDAGDCDDSNASVNPMATELCNGIDDDCDGPEDEGVKITFYKDEDGDGYGQDAFPQEACTVPVDYSKSAGDCDDSNPLVNPKAVELCNDVDDNCDNQVDGSSCADCVGSCGDGMMCRYTSIQAALIGSSQETIFVCPGTYFEYDITFPERDVNVNVKLISVGGPQSTVIDAQGNGTAIWIGSGRSESTEVRGFQIINGSGDDGGAIELSGSSPTISDCVFENNYASGYGGAIYGYNAFPIIHNCTFRDNQAGKYGGAVSLRANEFSADNSSQISNCLFFGNEAEAGGAVHVQKQSASIDNCAFWKNRATTTNVVGGGGVYANESTLQVRFSVFIDNVAANGKGDALCSVGFDSNKLYGSIFWGQDTDTEPVQCFWAGVLRPEDCPISYSVCPKANEVCPADGTNRFVYPFEEIVEPLVEPPDFHLPLGSAAIDGVCSEDGIDIDGSCWDMGIYGGELGQTWDRDLDGYFDYPWPGDWCDGLAGARMSFDCDDNNSQVASCDCPEEGTP